MTLQVVLTAVEVESLRSEIAALEEREAHLKAQYVLMLSLCSHIMSSAPLFYFFFKHICVWCGCLFEMIAL